MIRITKFIEEARSKLYYRQPVYIPGYEYSPWKKWIVLTPVAIIALLIITDYINHKKPIVDTSRNVSLSQTSTPTPSQQSTPKQKQSALKYYSVNRVVDGDTIAVNIDGTVEKVRLIGVDTPETVDPRKLVQCFGIEASNYVKTLLTSKNVALESDGSQGDKDKYNRLLRYVYLSDGTNLNEDIIAKGYGHEYTYNLPYKFQDKFKQAEHDAQTKNIGLWASNACNGKTN